MKREHGLLIALFASVCIIGYTHMMSGLAHSGPDMSSAQLKEAEPKICGPDNGK